MVNETASNKSVHASSANVCPPRVHLPRQRPPARQRRCNNQDVPLRLKELPGRIPHPQDQPRAVFGVTTRHPPALPNINTMVVDELACLQKTHILPETVTGVVRRVRVASCAFLEMRVNAATVSASSTKRTTFARLIGSRRTCGTGHTINKVVEESRARITKAVSSKPPRGQK